MEERGGFLMRGRTLFNISIIVLMIVLIAYSFQYNEKARLIPVTVGSIVLIMAIIQLLADTTSWKLWNALKNKPSSQEDEEEKIIKTDNKTSNVLLMWTPPPSINF